MKPDLIILKGKKVTHFCRRSAGTSIIYDLFGALLHTGDMVDVVPDKNTVWQNPYEQVIYETAVALLDGRKAFVLSRKLARTSLSSSGSYGSTMERKCANKVYEVDWDLTTNWTRIRLRSESPEISKYLWCIGWLEAL